MDTACIKDNEEAKIVSKKHKRERYLKHKRYLKHLHDMSLNYPAPVIYTDEIYVGKKGYVDNPKPYYKRIYRSRGCGASAWHKKASNRKIRRYKGDIPNGNWCHKLYDYWWQVC